MVEKIFDLPCMDGRKSFYGKAKVIECENGSKILQSYDTYVLKITSDRDVVKLWDGESATTMRHINSFLQFYGKNKISVKDWRKM